MPDSPTRTRRQRVLGAIPTPICEAVGYAKTIRIRRAAETLVRLRSAQEAEMEGYRAYLAEHPMGQATLASSTSVWARYDALAAATDELLLKLGDAGFLA